MVLKSYSKVNLSLRVNNKLKSGLHEIQSYFCLINLSDKIKNQIFWPSDWCKSFKHNLLPKWPFRIWKPAMLPNDTSIVAFTGKPDPDDVIKGIWPVKKSQFYKKIYKQLKTPEWVADNWS